MAALWRPSGSGSHARPPPQKRLHIFHAPDAHAQELVFHGQLSDDSLLSSALLVKQVLLSSRQEGVTPLAQSGASDAILAAYRLQIGATKQLQNDARFALG
jgi:hypothetical protein